LILQFLYLSKKLGCSAEMLLGSQRNSYWP